MAKSYLEFGQHGEGFPSKELSSAVWNQSLEVCSVLLAAILEVRSQMVVPWEACY